MSSVTAFGAVQSPIWNLPGEHRSAGALPSFSVGTRAEYGVRKDDGRRLHPCAVLALGGNITREIRRAGLEDCDVVTRRECFALLVVPEHLDLDAERLPVPRVCPTLQVVRRHQRVGDIDELIGVEVEMRKDRIETAGILAGIVALQEWVG